MFDSTRIRQDFPILSRTVHNKPLVYLDNAATAQKPRQVIEAIVEYYTQHNANVHRGVHTLSDESTIVLDQSRHIIAKFFGAQDEELIMVQNTTEGINAVAYGWGDAHLNEGDVIISTLMEHHSDLVVWQELCHRTGAQLVFLDVDEQGRIDLKQLQTMLTELPVKLVTVAHVSNTLGTVNPIQDMAQLIKAHRAQAKILVDGAQAAPHLPVNFNRLGVDFYIFSGHKMLGPMGSGGLLVKQELLQSNEMKPWLFGGGMIQSVTQAATEFSEDICERFTAGTPDVASTVGLAAACTYLNSIGMSEVERYDRELVAYALGKLAEMPELTLIGPTQPLAENQLLDRLSSVAFLYQGVHAHDVAQILDSEGIAVRSGHHCTMPLHLAYKWQATTRASFQVYTTKEEIDSLVASLAKVKKVFHIP